MRCDYCGNKFHDNGRGACVSCGAPAPIMPSNQDDDVISTVSVRAQSYISSVYVCSGDNTNEDIFRSGEML